MISTWTTSRDFIEIRVSGGDVDELSAAVKLIAEKHKKWHGDDGSAPSDTSLEWVVEEGAIVIRFPGAVHSVGAW